MKCPHCSGSLGEIDNEGVTLDFCSSCKGIWFDRGEVGKYFELSRDLPALGEEDREERSSNLSCPRCSDSQLTEMRYSPPYALIVDRCSSCGGMWFDQGEVQMLHKLSSLLEDPGSRFAGVNQKLKARGYYGSVSARRDDQK